MTHETDHGLCTSAMVAQQSASNCGVRVSEGVPLSPLHKNNWHCLAALTMDDEHMLCRSSSYIMLEELSLTCRIIIAAGVTVTMLSNNGSSESIHKYTNAQMKVK